VRSGGGMCWTADCWLVELYIPTTRARSMSKGRLFPQTPGLKLDTS